MPACRCGGRLLTNPVSFARGIGPVCAMTAKEHELSGRNSNLFGGPATIQLHGGSGPDLIPSAPG